MDGVLIAHQIMLALFLPQQKPELITHPGAGWGKRVGWWRPMGGSHWPTAGAGPGCFRQPRQGVPTAAQWVKVPTAVARFRAKVQFQSLALHRGLEDLALA